MLRSESEIRAEIERAKARVREARAGRHFIDAAYAAIMVGVLAWVLGEAPTRATRVKVNG